MRFVCVYLLLLPLVWCVSRDKCKYTRTNKLSWDPYTPLRDVHKQHTYTLKHSRGLMCVFLLEARWWELVCDGGQQWPQTLNREASVPLHPSDTHTHTDSHSAVCISLRPSETAQHLLCKSHTHTLPEFTARFSNELGGGPQWHLVPSICEEVCIVRDTKEGILGVTQRSRLGILCAHPSFRLSLQWIVFASHFRMTEARTSLSGFDSVRQGFPLESQLMTSTELSSLPQLHVPENWKLSCLSGEINVQVVWLWKMCF